MAATLYVVLFGDIEHDLWNVYGSFEASNDKQAIGKAIADGLKTDEPYCVAIPARSFTPHKITVDTTPKVKFV